MSRSRFVSTWIVALLFTTAAAPAPALAQTHDPAWFVQAGEGDRAVRSAAVGASIDFNALDASISNPWSFYGEAIVGEWFSHHHDDAQRTAFTQVTVAPVLRCTFGGALRDVFIEVGIGLSLIVPKFHDHDRRFATLFQFDDHAAIGLRFGPRDENELSVRAEHFSNGGVRQPNPGQNFAQLRYARHF